MAERPEQLRRQEQPAGSEQPRRQAWPASTERPAAFHDLLLAYRAALGESHQGLAALLGVSAKAVKTWERPPDHPSARTPPAEVFAHLCAHLREQGVLPAGDYAAFAAARTVRRRRRQNTTLAASTATSPASQHSHAPIPRRLTALIGRDALAGEVYALLQEPGVTLVTLTGPGGIGKTHLAMDVAARCREAFPDGAWWVELAPLGSPNDVAAGIAAQIGATTPTTSPARDRLLARLHTATMLLVLDNFEHVLPAAPLVSDLLAHCAGLTVLATSRAPLRLHGERERAVPPLERVAAGDLFVRRVRDTLPRFARSAENAAAIDGICARLDDVPLALELAARQMRRYGTPQVLLAALAPALPRLVDGPRDMPARQRTMRAAIAWSYALLTPQAQRLLRRLAVCRGGCALPAARSLGQDLSDLEAGIASLIEHGLVQRAARSREARLHLFEVVREYGLEQLAVTDEDDDARRRHADYYLALAEEAESFYQTPQQARWDGVLAPEHDNLSAALEWAIQRGHGAHTIRFIVALWHHWDRKGLPSQARRWADGALALAGNVPDALHARGLYAAANIPVMQNDDATAERWLRQGHDLAVRIGDQALLGDILTKWGVLAYRQGDHERTQLLYMRALETLETLGSVLKIAELRVNLGIAALLQWQPAEAEAHYTQAGAVLRERGDTRGYAMTRFGLGVARTMAEDWPGALDAYREGLTIARRLQDIDLFIYVIHGIAAVAGLTGDAESSARLFGAGARLCKELDVELPISFRSLVETAQDMVRDMMAEPDAFDGWYEDGTGLALAETLALARQCVSQRRPA